MIYDKTTIANLESDLVIVRQLLLGFHLSKKELIRANAIIYFLKIELKTRVKE